MGRRSDELLDLSVVVCGCDESLVGVEVEVDA